jgi:hypothetical protein
MIKLKLTFGKDSEKDTEFEIQSGELLEAAVKRATKEVPLGEFKREDVFNVVVNGHMIEHPFWNKISLKKEDNILITPKIRDGEFGQVFKQFLLVAITIVASVLLTPAGGATIGSALLVAGVTIAASLALNALIPPPVQDFGGGTGLDGGGVKDSQMYAISGQSNQMKRLGSVPKVYGTHRVFPTLAVTPYTELSVNPENGEIVQYLVTVYDFGLGTPQLSDIKIGDTPLTANSFEDFQYNFVDINRPDVLRDVFDLPLQQNFSLYKGDRSVASLSIDMSDGTENVQVAASNPLNLQQEIILDFVCPRGLYGFNSNGNINGRIANLQIEFAKVGFTDWKPYNDTSVVDDFDIIGGNDVDSFSAPVAALNPNDALFSTYYDSYGYSLNNYYSGADFNWVTAASVKYNQDKLVVPAAYPWQVGQSVSINTVFFGNITAVDTIVGRPELRRLTLDRLVPAAGQVFTWYGKNSLAVPGTIVYQPTAEVVSRIRSYNSIPGRANITGSRTAPVYASFRFTPKDIGQYQVRVRRLGSTGDYSQQKADDVTWGALTTATPRPPIVTDKRHVFMELRIRATNQLNGNIQNLSAVASQVLETYDPDTEIWSRAVTSNPAWIFVDLLTGEVNKKRVGVDRLHMESILAWRDYCDEVPAPPPSQSFSFQRFQANFLLDYDVTLQELLGQLGGSAQASLNIVDGKYGVLVDRLKTTPVQIFTPRNSKGFSSTRFYGPRPDGVKVKFIDPQLNWDMNEVTVYDNGKNEDNAVNLEEMTSFACTNQEQAWRFGRYMIAQNKLRQETINLSVDFEHLVCTRGDYVQISQDVMEVGGRPARVKAVNDAEFIIDDHLDIDPSLTYGVTHRAADGTIQTNQVSVIAANSFAIIGDKVIFRGMDTRPQVFDVHYRWGDVPTPVGTQKKEKNVAGVFGGVNTVYNLLNAPISSNDIQVWLNGILRTNWSLAGTVLTILGIDSSAQVLDTCYRIAAPDVTGSNRKLTDHEGNFDGSDTVYVLPETPISDDYVLLWANGNLRTDYTLVGDTITFVGENTEASEIDIQYRYAGGTSKMGTPENEFALVGVYDGEDTTYTLAHEPISGHDLIPYLNGTMRTDYTQGIQIPAVPDLVVIGEMGSIVFDCIVKSISPNDDLSAQLVLVERANEIFEYESSDELPEYDPQLSNTAKPEFQPPRAVTVLTLLANTQECAQTQSGYNYYAEVSWDIPLGSVYEYFEIWVNDARGYRNVANTNAKQFKVNIDQDRLGFEHGIKVVAVAASGRKLQLIDMPEVIFTPVTKSTEPSDVSGFGMSITNQTLQLTWDAIDDCDCSQYEIRYSPENNDVWEASVPLQIVDRNVNSVVVQARTGAYLIKAIDFAGNKSVNASRTITTIPNLFDLNIIEQFQDAPTFPGELEQTEKLGEAVVLTKLVDSPDAEVMQFNPEGFYVISDLLDLGDIYSVRLASYIRADGYRFGELMSSWEHLSEVDHLSTSESEDWNVITEYRATDEILSMADWVHLYDIEHINEGVGQGFTDWRPIPTIGDATGRVFQFRVKLESLTPNVTPRLFDALIKADMPDRTDNFENQVSHAINPTTITYSKRFNGPAPSPNVQITIDNPQSGDYWEFANKTLEGFDIRFYDVTNTQVVRQFDVAAKGYGSRHTVTI